MPTKAKIEEVSNLKSRFEASPSVAITDYAGLTVEKMTALRKQLRDNSVNYLIAKNTLLRIAAKEAGVEDVVKFFTGPTAVAFGQEDPGVLAKTLYDFGKKNDKPEIRALLIEGKVYEGADVERIAKLPNKDQLIAQVVGMVTAPLQSLVGTLDNIMRELIGTIEAMKEKAA